MKVARYIGNGEVAIVEEPEPALTPGGLIVQTEACGLCSGELMAWYMDQKVPHVLGHEVVGRVLQSDDERYPVGSRVFPHHHAPCLQCEFCLTQRFVHCAQWKRTKLRPGGMAEKFLVDAENLTDCLIVNDIEPEDAALIEPLACVVKAVRGIEATRPHVVGLGVMGLLHALLLGPTTVAYDLNPSRVEWARLLGVDARSPDAAELNIADAVFVCPGSQAAFDFGLKLAAPAATLVMFAPLGPGELLQIPQSVYFRDITLRNAYSCGPNDTEAAVAVIRDGQIQAKQVVTDFVTLDDLPVAYGKMKRGEILKAMVKF